MPKPRWKKTNLTMEQLIPIWQDMAAGVSDFQIANKEYSEGLTVSRSTVSKIREQLLLLPEEYDERLSPEVRAYKKELLSQRRGPQSVEGDNEASTKRVVNVRIEPNQRGSPDPQSYMGAGYFDIPLPSNEVLIAGITVETSDPSTPFRFIIYEKSQPIGYPDGAEVFWQQENAGRRFVYLKPDNDIYCDRDKCGHMHCGLATLGRPRRFDIDEQGLDDYFREAVTFTVDLQLK